MSPVAQFFALASIEVAGLFAIWFAIKSKVRRYLELENLLAGVREEARALVLELNETADRNVSLVEDRMNALRSLLDEVDRRIGVEKRELSSRAAEREVYEKLSRRRPIVPGSDRPIVPGTERPLFAERASAPLTAAERPAATAQRPAATAQRPTAAAEGPAAAAQPRETAEGPITFSLGIAAEAASAGRSGPEIVVSEDLVLSSKTKREEALELYRGGISAELIAARLGATVAEIELLVEMEERRSGSVGGMF